MSASKKYKQDANDDGPSAGRARSSSDVGDRATRQYNPAKSVADAISNAGAGNDSAKRKKFSVPSREGDDNSRGAGKGKAAGKSAEGKVYDDPIFEDERLQNCDPQHGMRVSTIRRSLTHTRFVS